MVEVVRRRGRRRSAERHQPLGAAAERYASMGWPVCAGVHPSRGRGTVEPGLACSCDRVGCPAPGAHPASPAWQMQATVDTRIIREWWHAHPEANIILITGRVFDVLDVPADAGESALAKLDAAGVATGPTGVAVCSIRPSAADPAAAGTSSTSKTRPVTRMTFASGRASHQLWITLVSTVACICQAGDTGWAPGAGHPTRSQEHARPGSIEPRLPR